MSRAAGEGHDLLSIEEYERLPTDDAFHDELVRGRIVREPPPASQHGWLQVRIARLLGEFVERNRLGLVLVETGFILADDPPTVRAPDVAFVAREHAAGYPSDRYGRTPPDLAVEIVSPTDRASALQEKVFDYLDAGVRLVWVIDSRSHTATVYRSHSDPSLLRVGDALGGEDVLSGLRIPLDELFMPG